MQMLSDQMGPILMVKRVFWQEEEKNISAVLQSRLSQCKCERTGGLPGGLSLLCLHSKYIKLHPGNG